MWFLLISGIYGEFLTKEEQMECTRYNVHLMYEQGLFFSFVELLSMEVE